MKTIEIEGKEYVMVHERILDFKKIHPEWNIITHIVELTDDKAVMRAEAHDEVGKVRSTGHACEYRRDSLINNTSFLENCETSAIGRCLGSLGIGINTAFASADEMAGVLHKEAGISPDNIIKKKQPVLWMTEKQFQSALQRCKDGEDDILQKCEANFKMKKEYRQALAECKVEIELPPADFFNT